MNGLLLNVICAFTIANTNPNIEKAQQTLDALYQNYAAPNTCLLRENYPFDQDSKATYLASEEQAKRRNEYSYLWPYSGTFSAVNALLESTGNKKYKKLLENKVLPGLEEYFDTRREPFAYSSYISSQPLSSTGANKRRNLKILVLMHREPYSLSNYFKLLKMMPI